MRHPHQGLPTPTYEHTHSLSLYTLTTPHRLAVPTYPKRTPTKTLSAHTQVYPDGAATGWLHWQPLGATVWLSKPMKTLDVPSLVRATAPAAARSITTHAHTPVRGRIELSGVVRCGAAG